MPMRAIVLTLLGFLAAAAPAAAAPPASVSIPEFPDALAYAPGHVLWVTHTGSGPLKVIQAPSTELASIPRTSPSSCHLAGVATPVRRPLASSPPTAAVRSPFRLPIRAWLQPREGHDDARNFVMASRVSCDVCSASRGAVAL